jgi:carbon storage regulator
MLVLSRKVGEKLIVGDAVIIINDISGDKVKLGIEAPPEVKVLRSELAGVPAKSTRYLPKVIPMEKVQPCEPT